MSLIAVSPRKTGVVLSGGLTAAKFTTRTKTDANFVPQWMRFCSGRFIVFGTGTGRKMYHVYDPDAGMGASVFASSVGAFKALITGMDYGDDDATLIATSLNSTSDAATTIYVSYDLGANWTTRSLGTTGLNWRQVTKGHWADGTPVWMVSAGNTLTRSLDNGQTWNSKSPKTSSTGIAGGRNGVNRIVVAGGLTMSYTNTGGETGSAAWTQILPFPASGQIPSLTQVSMSSVRWVHDRFFAIENTIGAFVMSFDGVSWQEIGYPYLGATATNIIYAEGMWLICAVGQNAYAYSYDCINWLSSAFPSGFLYGFGDYGNGKFMFFSSNLTTTYLTYSL